MLTPQQFDVVVAGAGMVGAASACLFARQGLKVGLVEARALGAASGENAAGGDPDSAAGGRVSAINLAACNLFKALEVWPAGQPVVACPYRAMRVWDQNSAAKISFLAADLGQPCLGYIIENRVLIALMLDKLRQNYHVTILDGVDVTAMDAIEADRAGMRLAVALQDRRIETRLLVGADGAASTVRNLSGMQTRFSDFAQDAIVTTVSTALSHRETAWQCFLDTGPVAMLPLADGRCAVVWSCDRAQADALMDLDAAAFRARLQALFMHELGAIHASLPRQRFALKQHHADRYIAASVALVGDAAHLTHPLAGLGANLGLVDAAALAEVVQQARAGGQHIGQHSVLRRYERWRRGDNALALALMTGFKEIFGSRRQAAKIVRSAGMNLAASLAPLNTLAANYATGLQGDLPALCRPASAR